MTIDEQFEIISKYKEGVQVWERNRYSNSDKDWKLVTVGHIFDFEYTHYAIGKPKLWQECLNEETDTNIALAKAIEHLNGEWRDFTFGVSSKDEHGRETRLSDAVYVKNLYKLWNIAAEYGKARKKNFEPITDENNYFKDK